MPYRPAAFVEPPRRRTGLRIVVALGVIVLLGLVGGGAYLVAGFAIASGDRLAADRALEQARTDNNRVAALVKTPDLKTGTGADADVTRLKSDLDAYRARIAPARASLTADMPRLRQASDKLRSDRGSFLLAPQRPALDQERQRVEAAMTALTAADQALTVADQQLAFSDALLAAAQLFEQVGEKLDANDLKGALAMYGQLDAAVAQVVELAKGTSIPQQLQSLATAFANTAADVERLVRAVQANDLRSMKALTPRVDADEKALESFDEKTAQAQAEEIFKPYQARYEAALKSAGFKLV